jgi:hypothetical protein
MTVAMGNDAIIDTPPDLICQLAEEQVEVEDGCLTCVLTLPG